MPTKVNGSGGQQPYDEKTGEFKSFNSFHKPTNEQKINELKETLKNTKGIFAKAKIKEQINFLESGFNTEEEYKQHKLKKEEEMKQKLLDEEKKKKLVEEEMKKAKEEKLQKEIAEAPEDKRKQFEIIQKYNPMLDDYHVGIRSPKDIKTFEETLQDEESFAWGDFSKEEAKEALKTGFITVYSSYPINQGVFVSTSKNQSEVYAGGKKLYSVKVPLKDVAWINGDEGQFAKI